MIRLANPEVNKCQSQILRFGFESEVLFARFTGEKKERWNKGVSK